ncbi:MAG: tRNA (N(6)-L-threonylcarbamoyladenosine(37)-C(2))-methylthiotransferase MtaB [Bacteroides sp.]|nr:tRNA (N(6)-L-threonylcarbamoyladenosine(37)-C(2))-methylthiotransferase MtaB [Bacteroides sp.]
MIDRSTFRGLTAHFHTFGCKLNFAETSSVARMLAERGIVRAQRGDRPDLVVVNTCSVTELADKKCRQAIRSMARRWPGVPIAVTGCYAQLKSSEVASLPGVAIVAGSDMKGQLADFIDRFLDERKPMLEVNPTAEIRSFTPSCERGDRTRWLLKVQDGCDYYCTYCTIPFARGRSRSPMIGDLVDQARHAAANGAVEIVLTGVNIGDFGRRNGQTFLQLIEQLDKVEGIERYRISSIEPNLLTDETIDFVAASRRFMPHFHVPLQSGSDEVLRLMHRHYDTALFRERMEHIRRAIPDAFIGVDLIVGARGETDELFERSKAFVESLDISRLHVFPYSERPGTKALSIDGMVDPAVRHRRAAVMIALSERKLDNFAARFTGQTRPVLIEHTRRRDGEYDLMSGHTDNYLRVEIPFDRSLANTITECRLTLDGTPGTGSDGVMNARINLKL